MLRIDPKLVAESLDIRVIQDPKSSQSRASHPKVIPNSLWIPRAPKAPKAREVLVFHDVKDEHNIHKIKKDHKVISQEGLGGRKFYDCQSAQIVIVTEKKSSALVSICKENWTLESSYRQDQRYSDPKASNKKSSKNSSDKYTQRNQHEVTLSNTKVTKVNGPYFHSTIAVLRSPARSMPECKWDRNVLPSTTISTNHQTAL